MTIRETIEQHNIGELTKMLQAGLDTNKKAGGFPPIVLAAGQADEDAIRLLLEAGARIEETARGMTALLFAAELGYETVCSVLLDAGANIDAQDSKGWTPLMHACYNGLDSVVQTLLSRQANITLRNQKNQTALDLAAELQHASAVLMLLSAGFNIEDSLAFETKKKKILSWINQQAPYIGASQSGDTTKLRELLQAKPEAIETRDDQGNTLFMIATKKRHTETMLALLDLGADVNAQTVGTLTALTHAARGGRVDLVKLLLSHGADPNSGSQPILAAAIHGYVEVIAALIAYAQSAGISLDFDRALMLATKQNKLDVIEMLRPYASSS